MRSSFLITTTATVAFAVGCTSWASVSDAFTPTPPTRTQQRIASKLSTSIISLFDSTKSHPFERSKSTLSSTVLRATLTAEEMSTMSEEDLFKTLGVEKEKLALGIDPDEVLEFIGTREDLINKFQTDIPTFTPTQAEAEVDKFFMDGEMLDLYIKYVRRKREDPNWEPVYAEAEEDNSPFAVVQRIVANYAIWIVAGLIVKDLIEEYFKKNGGGGSGGGEEVLVSSAVELVRQVSGVFSG